MNRRELFGALGVLSTTAMLNPSQAADHHHHGEMKDKTMMAPLGNHHLHFCGIHCAKKDPRIQIITQHYCGGVAGGMHQCLLYSSAEKDAKLLGVEYIVSDEVYRSLPEVEKRYWHPHTYEVLGGGLIAPGMDDEEEMTFMKGLLTTWGKTWHTWPDPNTPVPMGEPLLMWSLTGDGQEDKAVIVQRDREFNVNSAEIRKTRIETIGYNIPAVPGPKDIDTIGRQWTASGEDKPTKFKG